MRKTVRAFARSRVGLILTSTTGKYGYVSTTVPEGANWKEVIAGIFERATGIPVAAKDFRCIQKKVNHNARTKKRYEVIYCEAMLSDSKIIGSLQSHGLDGNLVQEIPYKEAATGKRLQDGVLAFMEKHALLVSR